MPDNLNPEQRSYCMSRNKRRDTSTEVRVRKELRARGFRYRVDFPGLPGRPDIVFTRAKVAVFIDGDFWHGYRFSRWEHKLSPFWKRKIQKNRARDQRNFRKLRSMGWCVLRVWEHQVCADLAACVQRIVEAVIAKMGAPPARCR